MTQELIERLEPCPFCQAEPEDCPQNSERPHPHRKGEWCVYIWCDNCDARGPEKRDQAEAIAAWNTRTAPNDMLLASVKESLEDVFYDTLNCGFDSDLLARAAIEACDQSQSARIAEHAREIEKAWREGWSTGYRSGMVDGGSDTCWCDEAGDWEKSKTRNSLTKDSTSATG